MWIMTPLNTHTPTQQIGLLAASLFYAIERIGELDTCIHVHTMMLSIWSSGILAVAAKETPAIYCIYYILWTMGNFYHVARIPAACQHHKSRPPCVICLDFRQAASLNFQVQVPFFLFSATLVHRGGRARPYRHDKSSAPSRVPLRSTTLHHFVLQRPHTRRRPKRLDCTQLCHRPLRLISI